MGASCSGKGLLRRQTPPLLLSPCAHLLLLLPPLPTACPALLPCSYDNGVTGGVITMRDFQERFFVSALVRG